MLRDVLDEGRKHCLTWRETMGLDIPLAMEFRLKAYLVAPLFDQSKWVSCKNPFLGKA